MPIPIFRLKLYLFVIVFTCRFSIIDGNIDVVSVSEEEPDKNPSYVYQMNTMEMVNFHKNRLEFDKNNDWKQSFHDAMTILHPNIDHKDVDDSNSNGISRMTQTNVLDGSLCKTIFDRNVWFNQIDCNCTKKNTELEYEVKCSPVNPTCGPLNTTCGQVSISGIVDVIGWGPFLTLKFCFQVVKFITEDITLPFPLCITIGPNLLQLLLLSLGIPLPVIAIIGVILGWFEPDEDSITTATLNSMDASSPLARYQNANNNNGNSVLRRRKYHHRKSNRNDNECQVSIGDNNFCQSCEFCNNGMGIKFDCSNIDQKYISMKHCTPIFGNNSLNAGISPVFDF